MPVLVSGGGPQLSNGGIVLGGSLRCIPRQTATCNRRLFPLATDIPSNALEIVNDANTTVVNLGNGVFRVEKTSGTDGSYDASAISTVGMAGDFVLRWQPIVSPANPGGFGVDAAPTGGAGYTSVDYFIRKGATNTISMWENGVSVGTSTLDTYLWIWRAGTDLNYGTGPTFWAASASPLRTVAGVTATLYADSSFSGADAQVEVRFYTQDDIAGTAALSFAPTGSLVGKGALSGASTIVFSPSSTLTGKGALTGTAPLTFAPTAIASGEGALTGSAALVFAPAGAVTGKGALAGASSVTFASSGTLDSGGVIGAITGTASIAFASAGTLSGIASLTGLTSLALSASGILTGVDQWTITEPIDSDFANDNPDAATWTEAAAAGGSFTEAAPNAGTWTEVPANSGAWN